MTTTYKIYTSLVEFPHVNGDFEESFDVSEKTYRELKSANRGTYGILPMTLCVIRADNLKNFLTDLFCPTFVHAALKVEKLAGQIILGIAFALLDIVTLPVRLITLLPRVVFGMIWTKENNPGYLFLQQHSKNPEIYKNLNSVYYTDVIHNEKTSKISDGKYYFSPVPTPVEFDKFSLI